MDSILYDSVNLIRFVNAVLDSLQVLRHRNATFFPVVIFQTSMFQLSYKRCINRINRINRFFAYKLLTLNSKQINMSRSEGTGFANGNYHLNS